MGQKHVDEIVRGVQGASEKTQIGRFHSLSVRVGVAGALKWFDQAFFSKRVNHLKDTVVAKVIEFYIPASFSKREKWLPAEQKGRLIEFPLPAKKSA
jgi:hypothetical protein